MLSESMWIFRFHHGESAQLNEQLHNTSHFGWGIAKLEKTTQMEKLSGREKAWAKTLSYTKT